MNKQWYVIRTATSWSISLLSQFEFRELLYAAHVIGIRLARPDEVALVTDYSGALKTDDRCENADERWHSTDVCWRCAWQQRQAV